LSREHNIHIHIVHHVRKGQSENDMPGKFDARGSGTIVDQVDQVITVWRNKKKEEMMRNPVNHAEWQEKPDCILSVDKHRHGEFEGLIGLWYNRQAYFYAPDKRCLTYDLRDTRIYEGQK
jgi:twinkle protein